MTTSEIINARNEIANLALAGDNRYSHEAIGAPDGDINSMETETGLPLVYRAANTSDVAVYSDGQRHFLVCEAHGPVAIYVSGGATSEAINASAVATASRTAAALPRLTAEAVSARAAAAEAFAAESGVLVTEAAPFMGGWSFFAHCVGPCGDRGAAVMEAIRRLGFVPSRHEVNDRRQRGATFYAKVAK